MIVKMKAFNKNIKVEVDGGTWPEREVPDAIAGLESDCYKANIARGLIHTAHRTRHPGMHGFHLSDMWAFMRYLWAFDYRSSDLRLRPEWEEMDSHQKTILSDDLGMGFTTQLLAEKLGFCNFADTKHFLKVTGSKYYKHCSGENNRSQKTPDFVAMDRAERFHIVECKGTQSSIRKLKNAMDKGKMQKQNLKSTDKSAVEYGLVVGLFIPRHKSSESATISIMDPDMGYISEFMDSMGKESVSRSIVQIDLAKHMALLGASTTANFLATTPTDELTERFPEHARDELDLLAGREKVVSPQPPLIEPYIDRYFYPAYLVISLHQPIIEGLLGASNLKGLFEDLRRRGKDTAWKEEGNALISSLGFRMELRY